MNNSIKKWLRTDEVAEYLNLSKTQVHVLKNSGQLPFTKLGGTLFFDKNDIDSILQQNKVGGVDE
ncbi:MAG: helix-turn-helix domain-containing protein [Balneolaceae bacterium]|nr:helix-turn-helix domain-containing protein [Balneolaceae bacterium]